MARLDARWDNFWERGQTWYGFDQDGPVQITYESAFTADAVARQTASGSLTSDAVLRGAWASSLATDAIVLREQASSFSADAVVVSGGSTEIVDAFTADAIIQIIVLLEDFNRITAEGLGPEYPGYNQLFIDDWRTGWHLDGSKLVLGTFDNSYYPDNDGDVFRGFPRSLERGLIQIDFKPQAASWFETGAMLFELGIIGDDFQISFQRSDDDLWLYLGAEPGTTLSYTRGEWHTFKLHFDTDGSWAYKFWERASPEPEAWDASGTTTWDQWQGWDPQFLLGAFSDPDLEVDNFLFTSETPQWTGGSWFPAFADISEGGPRFFADAVIVEAYVPPAQEFTVDACFVETYLVSFYAEAWIAAGYHFGWVTADAVVLRGMASSFIRADAEISPTKQFAFIACAWIQDLSGTIVGAFEQDAILLSGVAASFEADACMAQMPTIHSSSFSVKSEIYVPPTLRGGSLLLDAWVIGTSASFMADAQLSLPASPAGSLVADAFISSEYRLHEIQADAVLFMEQWESLMAEAFISGPTTEQSFTADALIGLSFTADAIKMQTVESGWFGAPIFLNAVIILSDATTHYRASQADAVIVGAGEIYGGFTASADVFRTITGEIENAALIVAGSSTPFTADAVLAAAIPADTTFTIDAFVREEPHVIFPPGGGGEVLDTYPSQRIQILIKNKYTNVTTDVTQHVVWAETTFTQQARIGPGTFNCVLRGKFTTWDGGEDIYVLVNDRRVFGGLILQVEFDYWFSDKAEPKTILLGADYNIYFDKLFLWNRDNSSSTGEYRPPNSYAKNTPDSELIKHVCHHLINLPSGFDYTTEVDTVDSTLNPDERWQVNTGQSFRSFMSEVSKMTNAVWWIDQFLVLHYQSRTKVTAPYAITDGAGGISCQNLSYTSDSSSMVNDIFVFGTLAATVTGEIYLARRKNETTIARHGLRQHAEVRSDLHHENHVNKRSDSIRSRRSIPVITASLDIFEPGFAAGQIVSLQIGTFGISKSLLIRQLQISFETSSQPVDDKYYGVPKYHLELGLQPDDPWNIYDMLPWDFPNWKFHPIWEIDIGELDWGDNGWQIVDDFSGARGPEANFGLATSERDELRYWQGGGGDT